MWLADTFESVIIRSFSNQLIQFKTLKIFFMKRLSSLSSLMIALASIFLLLTLWQCKKAGVVVKNLNRNVTPDSTVFGSFYDETKISTADVVPGINDIIKTRGIKTVLKEYCGTSNCHGEGAPIKPRLVSYSDIMPYVIPGSPESSKLWKYITTNDFDKAMPPVNSNYELPGQDKLAIYNWIKNGAKETTGLEDYRPTAIKLLTQGCTSANCHNQATAVGYWARRGFIPNMSSSDTTQFTYTNPVSGSVTVYPQMSNKAILDNVWGAYKDSVKKYYQDTLAYASFRPVKTFSSRGPLNTYDDIIMDIMYPKSVRNKADYLTSTDCFVRKMDSTLVYINPRTGAEASVDGKMAWDDGGFSPSEVALFKAWYFADPNIPTVWKYGINNAGIFKYKKSGNRITQR
jgi:hypothetical protein